MQYIGGMASPLERKYFNSAIKTVREMGAIITTHNIPDVDGLGAAYVLKKNFPGSNVDIVTDKTIERTDPLVDRLGMRLKRWDEIPESDERPIIVVDTNTTSLLNGAVGRRNDILAVIDHHRLTSIPLSSLINIRNETAISVCEIIASLIPSSRIDRSSALALAAGIAGDSERLLDTDNETLEIFVKLRRISQESKDTIDMLAYPPLRPETLAALLEDMRHLRTEIYKGNLIAIGKTTQEIPALLAMTLKDTGNNVSIAMARIKSSLYRLSFRVKYRDAMRGLYASEIAKKTSQKCGMCESMWGGGHIDKAGAVVHGSYDEVVSAAIESAKAVINRALAQTSNQLKSVAF